MAGRWGSFISGLESKLDTILADEDTTSKSKDLNVTSGQAETKAALAVPAASRARADGPSRSTSSNRVQDRLNERLAKAVANRTINTEDSSAATSNAPSRTASPVNAVVSPRTSIESGQNVSRIDGVRSTSSMIPRAADAENQANHNEKPITSVDDSILVTTSPEQHPVELQPILEAKLSSDIPISVVAELDDQVTNDSQRNEGHRAPAEYEQIITQMKSDYEAAEIQRQEEMHEYLERIDALQSKLQYFTRQANEIARNASSTADQGSPEQKLAFKDEKIATLMEEGHKLSQTELKHMSIIKKLRAKSDEDEKLLYEIRRAGERQARVTQEAQERARKAEATERRATERSRTLSKVERDLELMRVERENNISVIGDLRKELSDIRKAAEEADSKTHREALEAERKRRVELADDLARVKLEKETMERHTLAEIRELKEKMERDKERMRAAEIERQGEQDILESRLEAFRARAEEASAGSTGTVQTKLLRQIETLQNQYAVASENWQGIEGSLLARVSAVEKERDDMSKREMDVRQKARETGLNSRRIQGELEKALMKAQDLQHELTQQSAHMKNLHEKLRQAEADIAASRKELHAEREIWEAREGQRMEVEKGQQTEEMSRTPDALYQQFRTESTRNRKSSNADRQSPHGRRFHGLAISGTPVERPLSRRSSTQPLHAADPRPPSRQDSAPLSHVSLVNVNVPETPSMIVHDRHDFFDGVRTPASPEHTINDMISASTGGAGPSVQLVERMSAAVRRLESEKASSKDELARLSQQRDEAREQVVMLMRETEEKRKVDERVKLLEKENQAAQERYLTTLEMLGEKSEKVEELKADVTDLKQMYRELVDSTMR